MTRVLVEHGLRAKQNTNPQPEDVGDLKIRKLRRITARKALIGPMALHDHDRAANRPTSRRIRMIPPSAFHGDV